MANPRLRELRLARRFEPHVEPLNRFVEELRVTCGGGESVPWFDPDGGGVKARALVLLEAPGPRSVGPGSPRPLGGSGIITPDNDDPTAQNFFTLRESVGLPREFLVHWNIVPWYIGDGTKIRGANTADIREGTRYLEPLLGLLPETRAVLLMGRAAQRGWRMFGSLPTAALEVLSCPHPSPRGIARPEARAQVLDTLQRLNEIIGR